MATKSSTNPQLKIKIFDATYSTTVEERVNKFLEEQCKYSKNFKVVDVKYQTAQKDTAIGTTHSVLVLYTE